MLSSKYLIEKTKISRATLNNYIKLGILSKPTVSNPGSDGKGPRQLGYFPDDTVQKIESISRLKQEGYSMSEISNRLRSDGAPAPGLGFRREVDSPKVTLEDLDCPA